MATDSRISVGRCPPEICDSIAGYLPLESIVRMAGYDRAFREMATAAVQRAGFSSIEEMIAVEEVFEKILPFLRMNGCCSRSTMSYKKMLLSEVKAANLSIRAELRSHQKGFFFEVFKRAVADENLDPDITAAYVLNDQGFCQRVQVLRECETARSKDRLTEQERLIVDLWDGVKGLAQCTQEQQDNEILVLVASQPGDGEEDLQYASNRLKDYKPLVLEAVRKQGWPLMHASDRLRADEQVVFEAVSRAGCVLEYASPSCKANKSIVLAAVEENPDAEEFAELSLLLDPEVRRKVVESRVRHDEEMMTFQEVDETDM